LHQTDNKAEPVLLQMVAWSTVLLISNLPAIVGKELLHLDLPWLFTAHVVLLSAGLLLSLLTPTLRPLKAFFALFWVLYFAEYGAQVFAPMLAARGWRDSRGTLFVSEMMITQITRFGVALLMLAASWLLMRRRSAFFLGVGDLHAVAEPIPLVGMTRPSTWNRLAPIMAVCLAGGLVAFAIIAGGAPLANLPRALPLLPFVVLFAAMNAFGEEMSYRAPQLGALAPVVGESQALLMTAIYFGIGHFYGVPYGIVGVLMAGVLGWLLGRSMLETKGLLCAWLIHFAMDLVIFTFMAAGSISAGGR